MRSVVASRHSLLSETHFPVLVLNCSSSQKPSFSGCLVVSPNRHCETMRERSHQVDFGGTSHLHPLCEQLG